MKCIEESKIDWYNTRAGRTVVRPTVCDHITFNHLVGIKPGEKTRTRKQRRAHLQPENRILNRGAKYNPKTGTNKIVKKHRDPFKGCDINGTHWIK